MGEEKNRGKKKSHKKLCIILAAVFLLGGAINAFTDEEDAEPEQGSVTVIDRSVQKEEPQQEQEQTIQYNPVEQQEQKEPKEEIVLITNTGKRYHSHACTDGDYFEVTLSQAKGMGLTPCKKCYGG